VTSNVVPLPRRDASTAGPRDTRPPAGNRHRDASAQGGNVTLAPVARAVYTVKETAYLLSMSLGTTYQLIRSGKIPAMKVGGKWVVPKRRFHQWVDALPDASPEDIEQEFVREFGPNWRESS
jgi:excisionase family DNA binding protein